MRSPCVLAVVLTMATATNAMANDASFGPCSGALSALEGTACEPIANENIELVDEKLFIQLTSDAPESIDSTFHGVWRIEAAYTFLNHGEGTTVAIGYPLSVPPSEGRQTPLETLEYLVDGKAAEVELFDPNRNGDEAAKAAARDYGYSHVQLGRVAFEKGQTRTITHRYTQTQGSNYYGYTALRYLLRTGALWRGGSIGSIRIEVHIDEPLSHCVATTLGKWKASWDEGTFVFEAKDWRPPTDLQIRFLPSGNGAFWLWPGLFVGEEDDPLADATPAELRGFRDNLHLMYRDPGATQAAARYDCAESLAIGSREELNELGVWLRLDGGLMREATTLAEAFPYAPRVEGEALPKAARTALKRVERKLAGD